MLYRAALFLALAATLPVLADDEKPLDLAKVLSEEATRVRAFWDLQTQVGRTDKNSLVMDELKKKQAEERKDLNGKKVEGTATIKSVSKMPRKLPDGGFIDVVLVVGDIRSGAGTKNVNAVPADEMRAIKPGTKVAFRISARPADDNDPILIKLRAGQTVKVKGTLHSPTLYLKDCTFSFGKD
jgi:hypothetical protein